MSGYPLFIPEFVLCTNSSLFWFKIANELREFRNYLIKDLYLTELPGLKLKTPEPQDDVPPRNRFLAIILHYYNATFFICQ